MYLQIEQNISMQIVYHSVFIFVFIYFIFFFVKETASFSSWSYLKLILKYEITMMYLNTSSVYRSEINLCFISDERKYVKLALVNIAVL